MSFLKWVPGITLEVLEREAIIQAVRFYRDNKTAAAVALDMSYRSLSDKLVKYELDKEESEASRRKSEFEKENFLRRQRGLKVLTAMPEETEEEKLQRETYEETKRREEFLRRQKGSRNIDPGSINAAELDSRRRVKARDDAAGKRAHSLGSNGSVQKEASEESVSNSESGLDVQSDSRSTSQLEMPVPKRKKV